MPDIPKSPLASNYPSIHRQLQAIELYVDFGLSNWKNEETNAIMAIYHNLIANGWQIGISNDKTALSDRLDSRIHRRGHSGRIAVVSYREHLSQLQQGLGSDRPLVYCGCLNDLERELSEYDMFSGVESLTEIFSADKIQMDQLDTISSRFIGMVYSSVTEKRKIDIKRKN